MWKIGFRKQFQEVSFLLPAFVPALSFTPHDSAHLLTTSLGCLLCLFMLIHYTRLVVPSLFQLCIQIRRRATTGENEEGPRVKEGEVPVAFYSIIIIFHLRITDVG